MSAELLREAADELDRLHANGTQGVWKLWGMQVLADQDGASNVDTAVPVAQTYFRDENNKPRTWDADLIALLHNAAPALAAWLRGEADGWDFYDVTVKAALAQHPDGKLTVTHNTHDQAADVARAILGVTA